MRNKKGEVEKMQNIKKLSFEEIQTIVNDLVSGRSQVVQIEILVRLILICIKAILYENQSFMPGIVSHVEPLLYGEIAQIKDEFTKHKP